MWKKIWGWPVVGVVVVFTLGGGISFMTSGHVWIADVFYLAGSSLFVARFLTWEDARKQEPAKRLRVSIVAAVSALIVLTIAIAGNHRLNTHSVAEAKLLLYYLGAKLDGQTVTLAKSVDPTVQLQFQPRMFIDPNNPSSFCLAGISVGNEGDASVEVQSAYLDFPWKVTPVSSPWYPASEGTEFVENWNKTPISPHQPPIGLYPFYGTPTPAEEMKVRLRIFYGKTAEAAFTIRPPTD